MTQHRYRLLGSAAVAALGFSSPAWANCDLSQPDVICDGATGPNTTPVITGKRSVRFTNNQTQGTTTGLTVNGDATNGANVTIDAGSSITASQAASLGPGNALMAYNALTLRGGSNGVTALINGDLTSVSQYGLDASTTTASGLIDITQGAGSTIRGSSYSLGGFNYGFRAIHTQAIGGANTRITTNGNLIGGIEASSGDPATFNGAGAGTSAFQITNNGTITDLPNGLGGIQVTQFGTGDVSVVNNGRILTTGFGINVQSFGPDNVANASTNTITINGDIGSAAVRPRIAALLSIGENALATGDVRINLNNATIYGGLIASAGTQGNVGIVGTGSGSILDNTFVPNLITTLISAQNGLQKGAGSVTVDLTQTMTVDVRSSPGTRNAAISAGNSGNGGIMVNRSSGGGDLTVANGVAIALSNTNGVGIAAPVGPFIPNPSVNLATRLDNNNGSMAVTVGANRTVRSLSDDAIRLFSGYSTGSSVADINGAVFAGNVGVWGRGTRGDYAITVAGTGSISGVTGIELTTAADYIEPTRNLGDLTDTTIYQLNITPTVAGLQLAGVLTASNAGTVTGTTTGIRLVAGGTGIAIITNSGTLFGGTNAVAGSTAGTAFRITNTGTMTGAVNVTGSSVPTSLFTNSGTWNTGSGNSTFAGSLTSSGAINASNGAANTVTVNGNLVLTSTSTLRLDVGATQGATDRILVTGTASLAGSLGVFASGGTFTAGTYTLLTANGGRTGVFSPLTTTPNNPGVILRYDANNVFLDILAANPNETFSFSTRESLIFNAATVTTNRVNSFSTQIIGRLLGGTPLYDQTFAAPFGSTAVQNGVTAARAAITTAGGPGVIIGDPVRTSSSTTSVTTTGTSSFSLAGPGVQTVNTVTTFGPASIQVGILSACNVASLPSATRPTCTNPGGTTYAVGIDETNFNTITTTTYTVNETRTDTITDTLTEVYELNGQVVAVGSVHAEVQSGLFDLSGRLLGRLGQIEPGSAGWAEVYAFRVRQGGRRDARGLAGGFGLQIGEGLTLGFGVDHGRIDIDLPGALESGEISLTEIGASLRYDSGPFAATLAVVKGFGNADTSRSIIGRSDARYDVRVTGVAVDMGYTVETGGWTLRPSAGIDFVRISSDGFTETDTLGLVVGGAAAERVRASAGLSLDRDFGGFSLAASARYLVVLDGAERSLPVAFALAPTRLLDMSGPSELDGALLGARLGVPIAKGATLSLGYDGRFGGGYTGHSGTVGVWVNF